VRKITYGGAASLDGYFARKNDEMDWLLWSDELRTVMSEYWGTIDTILMGRRTYEVSRQMGGGGKGAKMNTYVFSRTLWCAKTRSIAMQPPSRDHIRDASRPVRVSLPPGIRQATGVCARWA
jgi:dihydrofolate reductase